MDGNGEKKKIRQYLSTWSFPVVVLVVVFLVLIFLAGWFLYLESNRNYGQLATSLITAAGVVLTLSMTQARAIEQQEREDKRHHARLESEAKMQDERLRMESEREHKRLASEAQKDRAQRSITQRIDLAEKLASAVEHLSSENELKQAAGVQEILFQIDDWHALIKSEIAGIEEKEPEINSRKGVLKEESLRRRQELFDIAYKFDTKNVELLKSRARGLKQRLVSGTDHSLVELDFSGMVIGWAKSAAEANFRIDLRKINAKSFIMSSSKMCYVDLSYAHFVEAVLSRADLRGAVFSRADLRGAVFSRADLRGAVFLEADLRGAFLSDANLYGADLSDTDLRGADFSRAGLHEVLFLGADLRGAVFLEADLRGAVFLEADLRGAVFWGANLYGAVLSYANLYGAVFSRADLRGAVLSDADLRGAVLSDANLYGADLSEANLQGVNLENVLFDQIALREKRLLDRAEYDDKTKFPDWLNPEEYGMQLVDETEHES